MDTLTLSSSLPAITVTPSANSVLLDTVILVATAVSVTIRVPLAIDGLHGVTLSDIIAHETVISDVLIQDGSISDIAYHNVGVKDQNDNS
jgi:hypothetical protein